MQFPNTVEANFDRPGAKTATIAQFAFVVPMYFDFALSLPLLFLNLIRTVFYDRIILIS
jgi:hypothetical protein